MAGDLNPGVRIKELGARSQNPEARIKEPGTRIKESGERRQNPEDRIQEPVSRSKNVTTAKIADGQITS